MYTQITAPKRWFQNRGGEPCPGGDIVTPTLNAAHSPTWMLVPVSYRLASYPSYITAAVDCLYARLHDVMTIPHCCRFIAASATKNLCMHYRRPAAWAACLVCETSGKTCGATHQTSVYVDHEQRRGRNLKERLRSQLETKRRIHSKTTRCLVFIYSSKHSQLIGNTVAACPPRSCC